MPRTTDNSKRILEIQKGFHLLGIENTDTLCANSTPYFKQYTLLKPVRTVQRSDSAPNEVLDAKLEQGS